MLFVRVKSFRLKNKTALIPSFTLLLINLVNDGNEFILSDFRVIKLSFVESDLSSKSFSLVKFMGALILLNELNDESALSLILAIRIRQRSSKGSK